MGRDEASETPVLLTKDMNIERKL